MPFDLNSSCPYYCVKMVLPVTTQKGIFRNSNSESLIDNHLEPSILEVQTIDQPNLLGHLVTSRAN